MKKIFLSLLGLLQTSLSFSEDIKDVKPPVSVPMPFWMLGLIFIFVLIVILVALYLIKIRRNRRVDVKPDPWDVALEKLVQLIGQNLVSQGKSKEHYAQLSQIIREYIESRFQIRAPEMTTEEFLISIQEKSILLTSQKESLKEFLTHCDMVKFAQYSPQAKEFQGSLDLARKFIEETRPTEVFKP